MHMIPLHIRVSSTGGEIVALARTYFENIARACPVEAKPLFGAPRDGVPAQLLQKLCGYSTLIAATMSTSYRAERAQASERYYCPAKAGRGTGTGRGYRGRWCVVLSALAPALGRIHPS